MGQNPTTGWQSQKTEDGSAIVFTNALGGFRWRGVRRDPLGREPVKFLGLGVEVFQETFNARQSVLV